MSSIFELWSLIIILGGNAARAQKKNPRKFSPATARPRQAQSNQGAPSATTVPKSMAPGDCGAPPRRRRVSAPSAREQNHVVANSCPLSAEPTHRMSSGTSRPGREWARVGLAESGHEFATTYFLKSRLYKKTRRGKPVSTFGRADTQDGHESAWPRVDTSLLRRISESLSFIRRHVSSPARLGQDIQESLYTVGIKKS